jgi:hypothetical protein
LTSKQFYGLRVEECGLCAHLQGDDRVVAQVLELRRAEELGISPELHRLLQCLDSIDGLAVDHTLSQAAGMESPPALFFSLRRKPLAVLDRLARSLTLAQRSTGVLWVVEISHQGQLVFVLRPRVFPLPETAGGPQGRKDWQQDLGHLAKALGRDLQLPWWDLRNSG